MKDESECHWSFTVHSFLHLHPSSFILSCHHSSLSFHCKSMRPVAGRVYLPHRREMPFRCFGRTGRRRTDRNSGAWLPTGSAIPPVSSCSAPTPGPSFIVRQAGRDQLEQAKGTQQTSSHTRCKRFPCQRQYRATRPQSITGGRMRVIRVRVEKEVGQPVPGQVLRTRHIWAQTQPFPGHAMRLRLSAQVGRHPAIAFQEPKHAPRYLPQ